MQFISRRQRVAAKAARKGVATYGAVKHARGRVDAKRDGGRSLESGRVVAVSGGALLAAAGAGAAVAHFADPQNGRRRRHVARDRAAATMRRGKREVARNLDRGSNAAVGAAHEAAKTVRREQQPDDLTLADKVQSTIFRATGASKGQVSVNAQGGVVYLRGELDVEEQIRDLVEAAGRVEGVRRVVSLLHTPGEPAPMNS